MAPVEPGPLERLLDWESVNSYPRNAAGSTIGERYQPAPGRRFAVKVLEIPVEDLDVVDLGLGDEGARRPIYVERGGRRHFRFLVHPESEALYAGLIATYGVAGTCEVSPTASARTVLLRAERVFAKLTLDRVQDGLGRAVPDWEVRRAVRISALARSIPPDDLAEHRVAIIPEVAGATVRLEHAAASYIDARQGTAFRHGLIYRSAAFVEDFPGLEIYPAFSLVSERDGAPPPLVAWWREAGGGTAASFEAFLDETVVAPIVRATAYLVFAQGIVPDAHLQNLLLVVHPRTRRAARVLFRDAGGMKVNLELRLARGLPVDALRTGSAAYDFKFARATENSRSPFYCWLNRFGFSADRGFGSVLGRHVPGFDPLAMTKRIDRRVRAALESHFPRAFTPDVRNVAACLRRFLDLHPPALPGGPGADPAALLALVVRQAADGQTVPLRPGWFAGPEPVATAHGVLYRDAAGPRLALIPPEGIGAPATSRPTHFEIDAIPEMILGARKRLRLGVPAPDPAVTPPGGAWATPAELPRAIRLGRGAAVAYCVVSGLDDALRTLAAARAVRLDVIDDWSGRSGPLQRLLLRRFRRAALRGREPRVMTIPQRRAAADLDVVE